MMRARGPIGGDRCPPTSFSRVYDWLHWALKMNSSATDVASEPDTRRRGEGAKKDRHLDHDFGQTTTI